MKILLVTNIICSNTYIFISIKLIWFYECVPVDSVKPWPSLPPKGCSWARTLTWWRMWQTRSSPPSHWRAHVTQGEVTRHCSSSLSRRATKLSLYPHLAWSRIILRCCLNLSCICRPIHISSKSLQNFDSYKHRVYMSTSIKHNTIWIATWLIQ